MTARIMGALLLGIFALPLFALWHTVFTQSTTTPLVSTVLTSHVGTTLLLIAAATLLALAIGVVTAVLVVFFEFPGRRLFEVALALPLLLPPYLVAIVYREAAHDLSVFGIVETLPGAAVILGLTLFPYPFLLLKLTLQAQATRYREVGKTLGLNRHETLKRIILPLALPALALGGTLVALEVLSDYGTASTLGIATLSILIHRTWFDLFDPGLATTLGLVSLLLPIGFVTIMALAFRGRSFANPGNRRTSASPRRLNVAAGLAAAVICTIPILLSSLMPLGIMLHWAVPLLASMRLETIFSDILATVWLGLLGAACSLAFALLLALLARTHGGRPWSWAAASLTSLNYAMPGVALAVSLLAIGNLLPWHWLWEFLGGSSLLIILGVLLRYAVFAFFAVEAGLRGISSHIDEVLEMVHGNGWLQRLRVMAALAGSYMLLAGMFVFVNGAKDLTLPLVLQPFGYKSLPLQVYNFAVVDLYAQAAVYGLCLAAVCFYPVVAIGRWFRAN